MHFTLLISEHKAIADRNILYTLYRDFGSSGCFKFYMAIKTFLKEQRKEATSRNSEQQRILFPPKVFNDI